ncbi:hypothetical protein GCM10027591_04230 [Zhihengliuella somnathii]
MNTTQRTRWAAPALSLVALLALSACGQSVAVESETEEAAGATVTSCGTEVSTTSVPERIVTMTPGMTDLVDRLGAADRIVGEAQTDTGEVSPSVSGNADITLLSDRTPPSREVTLGVNPDLVLSPTTYEFNAEQGFATQEQLETAGAAVYVAAGGCPDRRSDAEVTDIYDDIERIGALLGEDEAATELRAEAEAELTAVADAVEGQDELSVAQLYVEAETLSAIGASVEYDIIARAGGDNVFSPEDPAFADFFAASISPEIVVEKNPDAIVFTAADDAQAEATRQYFRKHFAEVTAVKDDRLIRLDATVVMPGAWGNIEAVRTVAENLYPNEF